MADLPKSIRVGWRDIAVEQWETNAAAAAHRFGEFDGMNGIIRIDTQYGQQKTAATLLHEVFHAAWDIGEMEDVDHSKQEVVVSVLSAQMAQVWRDNPEFVSFMTESLK